jgi:hypothetical protein
MAIRIFVEGVADSKFLNDFISHNYKINLGKEDIIETKGWTNILSEKSDGEFIKNQMTKNSDNDGINLLIFDADKDFSERIKEINEWKGKNNLEFEIFLWPNNKDRGDLETVLEKIINPKNTPIFECWDGYEDCLKSKKIEGRASSLTIPAKKTKIYGYLEALLGDNKSQKDKIKERNREYRNDEHWDLNSESLNELKEFLDKHFQ